MYNREKRVTNQHSIYTDKEIAMLTLIPVPKYCTVKEDALRVIPSNISYSVEAWSVHADAFRNCIIKAHGITLASGKGGIELIYEENLTEDSYRLVASDALRIYASSSEGLCYGLATAIQLCEAFDGKINVPTVEIEDRPDKDYRSLMVDLGREWHPFEKLLKYVDLCYFYKVKYLNLHFADNKLYTLPSRAFPKLCVEGKYYTEQQIKHLREYAVARGVVLVPEFECPGHAPVLNTYYPEVFADVSDSKNGVFFNELGEVIDNKALLCAGSDRAVNGVKTLIKEICDLFPEAPYLHIGGDEANISLWEQCSDCREYMRRNGIGSIKELYSDYIARITSYVLSLGKTPIVWEGFPEEGMDKIPKETIVISWENHYQTTPQLLSAGFNIINSSWKPLYMVPANLAPTPRFDWGAQNIFEWNVYNWQHWWENSKATLNPINVQPTEQVIGAMLCVWEMIFEQEISTLMVNLAAFSERLWQTERIRTFDDFRQTLSRTHYLSVKMIQDV